MVLKHSLRLGKQAITKSISYDGIIRNVSLELVLATVKFMAINWRSQSLLIWLLKHLASSKYLPNVQLNRNVAKFVIATPTIPYELIYAPSRYLILILRSSNIVSIWFDTQYWWNIEWILIIYEQALIKCWKG